MARIAIYTRVSTEDQAKEGFSLDAQKERLIAYCDAQGWEVAEEYMDDGHSGRNTRRPAYQRMMEEKDRWDMILVMKMDRIHRNSKNFMIMMENLERWGKKFTSMQESLDTSTAVGRFVVDIIQRIAQLESEQIGERTYMGMLQKAESGNGLLGFCPPFGFRFRDGKLSLVDDEASVVQDVYQRYLRGERIIEIVRRLNIEGIVTRRGRPWSVWSVSRMLHNPIYAGFLRWDGLMVPNDHEAIVSVEDFNKVQAILALRIKNPKHRKLVELPRAQSIDAACPASS